MTRATLFDEQRPYSARIARSVREHEILRIAASIGGKSPIQSALNARQEVLKWAEKRTGGKLPADAWAMRDFEYYSGGRNSIGVTIENGPSNVWAIRADDPDKFVPGR